MKNGIQQFGIMTLQIIVGICLIALMFYVIGFSGDNNLKAIGTSMGNQSVSVCDTCNKTFNMKETDKMYCNKCKDADGKNKVFPKTADGKCPDCGNRAFIVWEAMGLQYLKVTKCPDCGGELRKLSADRMNVTSGNINYRDKLPKMKISEISCAIGETLNVKELFDTLECEGCDKELTIAELNDGKCFDCGEKISLDYAVDYQGNDISDTVKMYGDGVLEGNTKFKADKSGIYDVTFIATDVNYDLIVKQKVKISVAEEIEGEG